MNNDHLLLAALISGLMSSMHCVGMCGGIASAFSMQFSKKTMTSRQTVLWYTVLYNLARVFSYSMAGLLAGLFSYQVTQSTASSLYFPLQVLASVVLILVALNILGLLPFVSYLDRLGRGLTPYLKNVSKILLPIDSPLKAFSLGLVWGWLPCGLVYSMLTVAITTGKVMDSVLVMFLFGLGTLPAMIAIGVLGGFNKQLLQHQGLKYVAAIILLLMAAVPFYTSMTHDHSTHHAHDDNAHQHHHH